MGASISEVESALGQFHFHLLQLPAGFKMDLNLEVETISLRN
jgi:hypothetical protein